MRLAICPTASWRNRLPLALSSQEGGCSSEGQRRALPSVRGPPAQARLWDTQRQGRPRKESCPSGKPAIIDPRDSILSCSVLCEFIFIGIDLISRRPADHLSRSPVIGRKHSSADMRVTTAGTRGLAGFLMLTRETKIA